MPGPAHDRLEFLMASTDFGGGSLANSATAVLGQGIEPRWTMGSSGVASYFSPIHAHNSGGGFSTQHSIETQDSEIKSSEIKSIDHVSEFFSTKQLLSGVDLPGNSAVNAGVNDQINLGQVSGDFLLNSWGQNRNLRRGETGGNFNQDFDHLGRRSGTDAPDRPLDPLTGAPQEETAAIAPDLPRSVNVPRNGVQSSVKNAVTFGINDSEAAIAAKNGPKVTIGTTTVYIGYRQVTSANKDPILVSFNNGVRRWVRTDYETTNDDGTGTGLAWDGSNLYAVFTSTGTQPGNGYSRFTGSGWLRGYTDGSPGGGGGSRVSILAKVDLATGNIQNATYLTARNDRRTVSVADDRTNSLTVKGLRFSGGTVTVQADSTYAPRRPDKTSMTQRVGGGALSANSSYNYEVVLAGNLGSALSTKAKDFV